MGVLKIITIVYLLGVIVNYFVNWSSLQKVYNSEVGEPLRIYDINVISSAALTSWYGVWIIFKYWVEGVILKVKLYFVPYFAKRHVRKIFKENGLNFDSMIKELDEEAENEKVQN